MYSEELYRLCWEYVDLEEYRQRLKAKIERGGRPLENLLEDVEIGLKERAKYIAKLLDGEPVWAKWLKYVKGIGVKHASVLIAYFDMENTNTTSRLWAYANLADRNKGSRRLKGHVIRLGMSLLGVRTISRSLFERMHVRGESKYARYFEKERKIVEETNPDWSPIRKFFKAFRKMLRLFLAHYKMTYDFFHKREVHIPYPVKLMIEGKLKGNHKVYLPFVDYSVKLDWLDALEVELRAKGVTVSREP